MSAANGRALARDILGSEEALLEAATLNRKAINAMHDGQRTEAWEFARVAWALAAYVEARKVTP